MFALNVYSCIFIKYVVRIFFCVVFVSYVYCFCIISLQAKMWQCLHRVIPPGCLLVTIPALETSLGNLKTGININSWVKPMAGYQPKGDDDDQMELSEIKLYEVLPKES